MQLPKRGQLGGAAFQLLSRVGKGSFEIALSVPLVLEYEDALLRHTDVTKLGQSGVDVVLDYFCKVAHLQQIFYLWRPFLPDPQDDFLLELAMAARCRAIITYTFEALSGRRSSVFLFSSQVRFSLALESSNEHT